MKKIRVKMADLNIGEVDDVLITSGLGSCVGIALYDSRTKIGGLAHIMLPEVPTNRKSKNPAKYADTSIELLLKKLRQKGANFRRLVAKIAGGAHMFKFDNSNPQMQIGARNIEAVKKILKEKNIRLLAEDVGKNYGRTMEFYLENGEVLIKTVKGEDRVL
ncbi:chemotaxis protein CheD [Selenihalanaerobacter shriftii]|uniref:Probable chemoreceptor glutamine deamidase CheD n=1 Tax=Selenihalanaerobacter shriftii TaxID=142842 RepID=A0A1T4MD53_9FIRM|nr:chemotaxis protein CheD [Selenihalanaerobacter shriftii]SJZ64684.1 chemotaxis protein CheD [Selenihalanaerobacter shriftii]